MRASDEMRKQCSICLHTTESHTVTKGDSSTGCRSCQCRRYVEAKVMRVQGDAEPEYKG